MRRIIFWIAFLWSLCSFSQVNEDFSDGDFTTDPCWSGDINEFIVDKKGQLKLNDKIEQKGLAYLSTPSFLLKDATWSFYVHLYFNPSANNYAKFYLASTESCLSDELNGYYVMIGGADDNVALYRQEGHYTEKLITGKSKMVKVNSPELLIKVHCDKDGKWTLLSQLIGTDEDYTQEGTITDKLIQKSSYIGVECVYTASRGTSFAFDNIVVEAGESPDDPGDNPQQPEEPDVPDPDDMTPPKLLSVSATTDSTLILVFNESINASKGIFSIDTAHREKRRVLSPDKRTLTLIFSGKFDDNEKYTILVSGIKDVAGNYMPDSWINFVYYDTSLQTVNFGDLVFNEIMANPKGVNSLPEAEYVELYNRTARPVNLNSWMFCYGTKKYKLPDCLIQPGSYLALCNEKVSGMWEDYSIPVVGVKSFPELANTGKLLWLEDARGNVVAWVEYTDTWYKDNFKKKGGFSLECIDTDNLSNGAGNWSACTDKAGGTPGKVNSIRGNYPDETIPKVSNTYLLSPDTLIINFTKPMNIALLAMKDHYTVRAGVSSVNSVKPSLPTGNSVSIILSEKLEPGNVLELELQRLKDISGFDLQGDLILKTGLPEDALPGEVLFNEVLFNPRAGGSDYVEIYNNSEKYQNLNRLFFSSRQEDGSLGEGVVLSVAPRVMAPYTYLCLTKDVSGVSSQYECAEDCMVAISKLPALPDDKGNILLLSPSGDKIDEFNYTEKMHTAFLDDKEGISLEKIYPDKHSGDVMNWLSASSASGGGTPGYVNSQYHEPSADSQEGFWLEQKSFTPDGDGQDDKLLIFYRSAEENGIANVKVYDASGRLVNAIAEDYRLSPEGVFAWNGAESGGGTARIGLYIIYVEAYTPNGKIQRYKLGCALSR